jgi:hypothetical protein
MLIFKDIENMNSIDISTDSLNRKTFFNLGVFLIFVFLVDSANAQNFTSKQNGKWNQNTTWNSAHNCTQNVSAGIPPISKSWGCGISVVINHNVEFPGNANNFGNGVFNGITIKSGASLNFTGNVTFSGGGSVPTFVLESGATMNVAGTFTVNRPVRIVIPANAVVTIRNLVVGDNQPEITVQDGGQLIVLETTTLRSRSTLNVQGRLTTNNLTFTSGGTLNANSNSATIEVANDLTVTNGNLNMSLQSSILVNGNTNAGQSGTISLTQSARAEFQGQVVIPNGATIRLANTSSFLFGNNMDMSGGGRLELRNNTVGVIQGNVIMPNGRIETYNSSEVNIGGRLTATNGGAVQTNNSSSVNICDYPNSTQVNEYHITVKNNSFYGEGCFALPVVWGAISGQFDAFKKHTTILWETTKEWETSHFEVERSLNGIDGYVVVGEITAVGFSDLTTSYKLEDQNLPTHKGAIFYRIKQIDLDGTFAYSDTFSLIIDNTVKNENGLKWVAYPNPTTGDNFNIKLADNSSIGSEPITARIISKGNAETVEANDLATLSLLIGQQIRQAPKGVCVIEVVQGSEITHLKILKH